jgi:DNA topoisomerase-2
MRFEYYIKRKNYILNILNKELKHSENKVRFIQEIIEKKLNIMNVDEEIIIKDLEKGGYDKEYKKDSDETEESSSGYNYLLKLQVRTFTSNIFLCYRKAKFRRSLSSFSLAANLY